MIDLKIVFDGDWVKSKASEGVRIVRILEKWIAASGIAKMKASSVDTVVVEMDAAKRAAFEAALAKKLQGDFKVKDPADIVSYNELPAKGSTSETGGGEPKAEGGSAEAKPAGEKQKPAEKEKPAREAPAKTARQEASAKKGDAERSGAEASGRGKDTLDALLASVPFKYSRELSAYMREVDSVIPMLQKMDAMASFWQQSLLLAIDDGYGLTDFLRALGRLYGNRGIAKADLGDRAVREMRIGVGAHESCLYDDWEQAVSVAKDMRRANDHDAGSRPVLCLDVGAWQDKLLRGEVKSFLRQLKANSDNFTVVFRIPFVEARTMNSVAEALGDIFSIRPLVVPPVSLGSLAEYARGQLAKRDFPLAADAMEGVEKMILYEKRDDSFFGYKTVDKIVDSIIYGKAVGNCRAGKEERGITRADVAACLPGGDESEDGPRRELESLVGLASVKEKVSEIVAQIKMQKRLSAKGRRVRRPAIHMLFTGNPGTGKTTVARIVARLLRDEGVLRKGHLIEVKGRDLCGEYVGQTAPKTSAICRDAYGSVLFIDEAYSLFRGDGNDRDYGREALDTLIAEMENHRDDMCVIMAGYTDEMETMLRGNSGLKSRIPFAVDFPNYTKEELGNIFFSMAGNNFEYEKPLEKAVRDFFASIPDEALSDKGFSNARFVRNLYERTWGKAAYRSRLDDGEIKLLASDLAGAAEEKEFKQLMERTVRRPMGFGTWTDLK